jgi:hypothetical protein
MKNGREIGKIGARANRWIGLGLVLKDEQIAVSEDVRGDGMCC